jgi:putative transposase
MVKKHNNWFPGAIFHVTCFGPWCQRIFYEDADFVTYLSILERVRYQYPFYLHSYCLIANRILLLLETTHIPIKDVITTLNLEYSRYIQRKYSFFPEFQHHTSLIDSVEHLLNASKSTHLAPLQENHPLNKYTWSSYLAFISSVPNDHVVTSQILSYFKHPKSTHYYLFVEGEENRGKYLWENTQKEAFP